MKLGDLITPNPECGFLNGEVYLYAESSLRDHEFLIPFRIGEIGTLLELSLTYQEYNDLYDDIKEWIPVCKILAPLGTGWIMRNYLSAVH